MLRPFIAAILGLLAASAMARESCVPAGKCGGFPRLHVRTPAGWSIGLVAVRQGFLRWLHGRHAVTTFIHTSRPP